MAKSLRSKVKRHFRAKKREEGVYAATEAARLHRLHMKLKTLTTTEPEEHDEDGKQGAQMETEGGAAPSAGWSPSPSWFASLGLLDPHDISVDSMAAFTCLSDLARGGALLAYDMSTSRSAAAGKHNGVQSRTTLAASAGDACGLDHLFLDLPLGSGF
ncbi:hypothetical protein BN946_scf185043.g79 [Trametes cinnabarina]|uniref:DUF2423 domain-containing protein n=1 Tax=Pycnoporus cinnabarinus TaxID=5643 RepID=A0A060SP70_PYCCI|nr:hypothetical protein BN946_scf185043.g79 [Trametes cinnabarina]